MYIFSIASEETDCVQCHLKLWTGANEAAADWFHVTLPVKLDCNELVHAHFFTAFMPLL